MFNNRSLGCVLYELLKLEMLFDCKEELIEKMIKTFNVDTIKDRFANRNHFNIFLRNELFK